MEVKIWIAVDELLGSRTPEFFNEYRDEIYTDGCSFDGDTILCPSIGIQDKWYRIVAQFEGENHVD